MVTVAAVLVGTAAATVLMDRGFSDATPHGRLLGALADVADAQEVWYGDRGRFASLRDSLSVEPPPGVDLQVVRGDAAGWKALARSPDVGLSCVQEGSAEGSRPRRSRPVCYTDPPPAR